MPAGRADRPALQHLAEDVLENAAVVVVGDFEGSVYASGGGERLYRAAGIAGVDLNFFSGLEVLS